MKLMKSLIITIGIVTVGIILGACTWGGVIAQPNNEKETINTNSIDTLIDSTRVTEDSSNTDTLYPIVFDPSITGWKDTIIQ